MKCKAGIIGGAGFAGIELARILLAHPDFELIHVTSDSYEGTPLSKAYPSFVGKTDLVFEANDKADLASLDVVFLAVPHTVALKHAPELIAQGVSVIDLSADFRLKDARVYESYYGVKHTEPELLAACAFGLPELEGEGLAVLAQKHASGNAVLVGCAGCYPTATSLAAAPALRGGFMQKGSVVIADAISGVTGAGKKASERTHFCFANDNVEAYGLINHRHTPEIEQILGIHDQLVFTPHLAPMNRGILSTVTIQLDASCPLDSTEAFTGYYQDFYKESHFVSVLDAGVMPKTSSVAGTNNAHIGVAYNPRTHSLIALGAIDNLCKGAAGQAVQCANIVFGLPETAGLDNLALPV